MATIIETGIEVHIGNDLPKEYSFSKYSNNIRTQSKDIWDAKANFSPAIQEMIEIATNRRWEKEKHKHKEHPSRFKYGFYRYDSSVAIPREDGYIVYGVELVIRNDAKSL